LTEFRNKKLVRIDKGEEIGVKKGKRKRLGEGEANSIE